MLDAEREVLNNRDQLALAQSDTATALVSVYWALGCADCAVTALTGSSSCQPVRCAGKARVRDC